MNRKKRWIFIAVFFVLLPTIYFTHPLYLSAFGHLMVVSDPLEKADAIIVLGGDYPRDERLLHAVQLWKTGYAPKVILSAKMAGWQSHEDYPSWRHAVKLQIFPEDALLVAAHNADSTKEEARGLLIFIKHHGFKKVIIVTSNYHTWRTKKVYEKEWRGSDVRVCISPAYSSQFHPDEWWKHRTDSRTFFYEFTKIIWYAIKE